MLEMGRELSRRKDDKSVPLEVKRAVNFVIVGILLMVASLYVDSPLGFTATFVVGALLIFSGILSWGGLVLREAKEKGMFQ
jgi:hypothetical protein